MTKTLFPHEKRTTHLAPGAILLKGFTLEHEAEILLEIENIVSISPLRNMMIAGGYHMSVAMSNCGKVCRVSDKSGYRYEALDPETKKPWPAMPAIFISLAQKAASEAGYNNFNPDACLINCYIPFTKLSLHHDKDEVDFSAPIVSVSLGLPATFLFGGLKHQDPTKKILVQHGDVVVFGGESRMVYHGIAPLKKGQHPFLGKRRINLTFRKAI